MKKIIYIFLGCLAVMLGAIGVVTPVLPTTPFL
ncbi:MAG: YbaN family protein, partial [Prevotellaceae bacterium]|nr:YbaN family protein [Prevotellaceae bacterium]